LPLLLIISSLYPLSIALELCSKFIPEFAFFFPNFVLDLKKSLQILGRQRGRSSQRNPVVVGLDDETISI
jgi:hypothetical protein